MALDITMIMFILGVIVLIIGAAMSMKKSSKHTGKTALVFGGIFIVLGLIFFAVGSPAGNTGLGALTAGGNTSGGSSNTIYTGAASIQLSATDALTGGNITAIDGLLYRNGTLAADMNVGAAAANATAAISNGDKYFLVVNNSGATTYYPVQTPEATANGNAAQLVPVTLSKIGTVTATVKNDDGSTVNAGTTAGENSISTGQNKKFYLTLDGGTLNANFGDSAFAVCLDYNLGAYTSLNLTSLTSGRLVTPQGINGATTQDATHNLGLNCYVVNGAIVNNSGVNSEVQLLVNAQASSVADPSAADSNIGYRVVDQCLVKNSNTGKYQESFFDPVSNAVQCGTDLTGTMYVK